MDRNPANDLKDTMWHFLMDGDNVLHRMRGDSACAVREIGRVGVRRLRGEE